jgi:predicted  nucleic acid-binding Zn-ribbon protein
VSLDLTDQLFEDYERLRVKLEEIQSAPNVAAPSTLIKVDEEQVETLRTQLADAELNVQAACNRADQLSEEVRGLRGQIAKLQAQRAEPAAPNQDQLSQRLKLAILDRDDLRNQLERAKTEIDRLVEQRERNRNRN